MKSFITHQILRVDVAWYKPAYNVEKNKCKCVIWAVTQSSYLIMIIEEENDWKF